MAKIRKNTKKEIIGWRNGLLHYFNVWKDNVMIGNGYCVSRGEHVGQPVLIGLNGERLPEDWYTLQMTKYKICIVPKRIQ